MNPESKPAPIGEIVGLACALIAAAAFLFMPWHSVLGLVGTTGYETMQLGQRGGQPGVLAIYEVVAGILIGGVGAVWGLMSPGSRRRARWIVLAGGIIGILYYVDYFTQTSQIGGSNFVTTDFYIALIAFVGMIVQAFIPRPSGK